MSTWSKITTYGKGTIKGYRLMIEGWPEMFVSNTAITATDTTDDRIVLGGLKCEGIQIHDRIIPQEAKIQASGNTFRIVPTSGSETTDPIIASFSQYPEPIAVLDLALSTTGVTLSTVGSNTLDDGHYSIGTETLRVNTWPTIERAAWDTQPQAHNISRLDKTKTVYIYDRPPTMEGRRCYLYVYGADDAVTGTGTLIWRGIVSRAPKLDRDCVTWIIEALPITHVLTQTVAGGEGDTHPVGIYHHSRCTFGFYMQDGEGNVTDIFRYPEEGSADSGIDTEATFIATMNAKLAAKITSEGFDDIVSSITLEKDPGAEGKFAFRIVAVADPVSGFRIVGGSPILGWVDTYHDGMFYNEVDSGGDPTGVQLSISGARSLQDFVVGDPSPDGDFVGGIIYYAPLKYTPEGYKLPGNDYRYDGGGAATGIGDVHNFFRTYARGSAFYGRADRDNPKMLFVHETVGDYTTWPHNRIYVDKDLQGEFAVHIEGTHKADGAFGITDTGTDTLDGELVNFIEITPTTLVVPGSDYFEEAEKFKAKALQAGFTGALNVGATIRPVRSYGQGVSLPAFIVALKFMSQFANDGDTPFITNADLSTWALGLDTVPSSLLYRQYIFTRAKRLSDVLAEECKLAGHLMRIESDGRIGIVPIPSVTETMPVEDTHTIDGDSIITPAGSYGEWPTVEPQRDGLVTMISIQEQYDPIADEWTDQPQVYQDADAVAAHKTRGKSPLEIRPFSRLTVPASPADNLALAQKLLAFFARDYVVITVQVPFSKFNILCGDTVSLTHRLIPDGRGGRGIVARRAFCIERRWNMDPKGEAHGTLTLWMSARPLAGYAPGGIITAQSNTTGNTWDLTLSVANAFNIEMSTDADGQVLKHFSDGMAVRVVQVDDATPTTVTGTISGTPDADAGTCTVVLDGAWTPGSDDWYLEYGAHGSQNTEQRKYASVADTDLELSNGDFTRRLS